MNASSCLGSAAHLVWVFWVPPVDAQNPEKQFNHPNFCSPDEWSINLN